MRILYAIRHICWVFGQIILQLRLKPNTRVILLNWWWESELRQFGVARDRYLKLNWFDRFLRLRLPNKKSRFFFFGVFGPKWLISIFPVRRSVFFTQEALIGRHVSYANYCLPGVGLGLGFEARSNLRVLRLPYWVTCFISPKESGEGLMSPTDFIKKIESRSYAEWHNRAVFCSIVARHDSHGNGAGQRGAVVDALQHLGQVECAGSWRNNTTRLKVQFEDDLLNYLEQGKFNICLENSDSEGYVTEKLWQAFLAGCIPVYWGDSNSPEPEILNPKRIVLVNPENIDTAINQINRLQNDEEYCRGWFKEPVFLPSAAQQINKMLDDLELRLANMD